MTEEELAQAFHEARPRLVRLAYTVGGSHAEAEDVVAGVWFRMAAAHRIDPIRDVDGWATVAVARSALDTLRSARRRKETYIGPWLPEPEVGSWPEAGDPADHVTLDESVTFALLIVLESLSPAERTSWVLHDLFGLNFDEVATVVGRTPAAVRQLAVRARRHVADGSPRIGVDSVTHNAVVSAFARAASEGDLQGLIAVLDPTVVLTSDGGGIVSAARRPVSGVDRVSRFILGLAAKYDNAVLKDISVNGERGLALMDGDHMVAVVSIAVDGRRIARLDLVVSPLKLPRAAL